MNMRVDFSNLGGLPFDQGTAAWMQASYRNGLSAVAKLCGNKTILDGLVVTGNQVSSGWIAIEGELIPFVGGTLANDVVVVEVAAPAVTFDDDAVREVYFTKQAYCGTPGSFPFNQLKRLQPLRDTWCIGDVKEVVCDATYVATHFSSTGLGLANGERFGWAICNGQNGTQPRKGRVAVQWDADNPKFNLLGETGGAETVALDVNELPPHNHKVGTTGGQGSTDPARALQRSASPKDSYSNGDGGDDGFIERTGGGEAHNNLQPYVVSLFIQKIF